MKVHLETSVVQPSRPLFLTGSKSITNRMLLLQACFPNVILENLSNAEDSQVMVAALQQSNDYHAPTIIDIHQAGTAMRFLTAYFAIQEGKDIILTGSKRMKERPIGILVEALRHLGANIQYLEKEGCPPLRIKGKKITHSKVALPAHVSSQYISALLLIAPLLPHGLQLTLEGEITSLPYINMTLALLEEIGVATTFDQNVIHVGTSNNRSITKNITIESDWTSASYWYAIVALSAIGTQITLFYFKSNSLQGDSILGSLFADFGVKTIFNSNHSLTIVKEQDCRQTLFSYHLNHSPDLAQTLAVTCVGLGISCHLTGLHTLKIKETDRLVALQNELQKLGTIVHITPDSLTVHPKTAVPSDISIQTYQDHRMALAFAPLALKVPICIEEAQVVVKSYPTFWDDLRAVGFSFTVSESNY